MNRLKEAIQVVKELEPRHWQALKVANRLEVFQSIICNDPPSARRYAIFCAGGTMAALSDGVKSKQQKRRITMDAADWLATAMEPACFAAYEAEIFRLMGKRRSIRRYMVRLQLGLYGAAVARASPRFTRKGEMVVAV